MSEVPFKLGDQADEPRSRTYGASDEHLPTTRLPAITVGGSQPGLAPLPPARVPSGPPSAGSATAPSLVQTGTLPLTPSPVDGSRVPSSRRGFWETLVGVGGRPANASADVASTDDPIIRQRFAVGSAALGSVVTVAALFIGLSEAPQPLLATPMVAASVVLSRALVAVGLLAVGITCLRAAERLYFR